MTIFASLPLKVWLGLLLLIVGGIAVLVEKMKD